MTWNTHLQQEGERKRVLTGIYWNALLDYLEQFRCCCATVSSKIRRWGKASSLCAASLIANRFMTSVSSAEDRKVCRGESLHFCVSEGVGSVCALRVNQRALGKHFLGYNLCFTSPHVTLSVIDVVSRLPTGPLCEHESMQLYFTSLWSVWTSGKPQKVASQDCVHSTVMWQSSGLEFQMCSTADIFCCISFNRYLSYRTARQ